MEEYRDRSQELNEAIRQITQQGGFPTALTLSELNLMPSGYTIPVKAWHGDPESTGCQYHEDELHVNSVLTGDRVMLQCFGTKLDEEGDIEQIATCFLTLPQARQLAQALLAVPGEMQEFMLHKVERDKKELRQEAE